MKTTNALLALNSVLLAALLWAAIGIKGQLQTPTVGELDKLFRTDRAAYAERLKQIPRVETELPSLLQVEVKNVFPIEVKVVR